MFEYQRAAIKDAEKQVRYCQFQLSVLDIREVNHEILGIELTDTGDNTGTPEGGEARAPRRMRATS